MNITVEGTITDIFPPETFGNFTKRVAWVLETGVQYPNHYALEFHANDVNILEDYSPGDIVKCKVVIRGRKWEKGGKAGVINTLKCWSVDRVGGPAKPVHSTRQQTGRAGTGTPQPPAGGFQQVGDDDDLPF